MKRVAETVANDENKKANYGFHAQKTASDSEEEEENSQDETPETPNPNRLHYITAINQLKLRYPDLALRSTSGLIAALNQASDIDLQSMYENLRTDIVFQKGTPVARLLLRGSVLLEWLVPEWFAGYQERNLADDELKKDIESEAMDITGAFGTKTMIGLRLVNNAVDAREENLKRRAPFFLEPREITKPLQSDGGGGPIGDGPGREPPTVTV